MIDTCNVENVMDSWEARDSVENGSDSSGCDTSDCVAVGVLIFLRLLYLDSCRKWFYSDSCCLLCVVCSVSPPSLIVGLHSDSHSVCVSSCTSQP